MDKVCFAILSTIALAMAVNITHYQSIIRTRYYMQEKYMSVCYTSNLTVSFCADLGTGSAPALWAGWLPSTSSNYPEVH